MAANCTLNDPISQFTRLGWFSRSTGNGDFQIESGGAFVSNVGEMEPTHSPVPPATSATSWYREAALRRVSAAEPLDQLISLPTTDGRLICLLLTLLALSGAAAWWIMR